MNKHLIMLKAFKYRLLPNTEQAEYIKRTIGSARFVYNNLLSDYKQQLNNYKKTQKPKDKPVIKEVTFLKANNSFLSEVDSLALANAKQNLKAALTNFFNAKKVKGSNNRNKTRIALANLDRHIANCRKDFCHKASKYYASNFDVIVLEDINMQEQAKSKLRGHGKSVNDLGFGEFKAFLDYKCKEYGTELVFADKWFPSSKTCNNCGNVNKGLKLSDREWICPVCGEVINRDYNAACNLRDWYFRNNTAGTAEINACGEYASTLQIPVEQVNSTKQEAPSFREG